MEIKFDKTYRPIHPGEVLKDEIEYRGISQSKLSAQMGMSYKVLNHKSDGYALSDIILHRKSHPNGWLFLNE